MYFPDSEILDRLLCPSCKERFDIPKVLPCGYSICSRCEGNLSKWDEKSYECTVCKEAHTISDEKPTLPVNLFIQDLLNLKPIEVYRGKLYEKTKDLLNNVENAYYNLKSELDNSSLRVQTHCDLLRDEIDIATESRIASITKHRDELVQRVNDYEDKCIENTTKENENIHKIRLSIENINGKLERYKLELKRPNLNEIENERIINELHELDKQLSENLKKLHKNIFNNSLLTFIENKEELKAADIGILSQYVDATLVNVDHVKSLIADPTQINYKIETNLLYLYTTITSFKDDKIVVAAIVQSTDYFELNEIFFVKIKLLSKQGLVLNEITQSTVQQSFVHLTSVENLIAVVVQDVNNNHLLQLHDDKLVLVKTMTITEYTIAQIQGLDNLLYVISRNKMPLIHVFNENLQEIETFGQNYDPHNAFYLTNFLKLSIREAFIFVLKDFSVEIIDRRSGILAKTIEFKNPISSFLFQADSNSTFILLNFKTKLFQIYDIYGQVLHEIAFQDVNHIKNFAIFSNGDLVLLDDTAHKIYVY